MIDEKVTIVTGSLHGIKALNAKLLGEMGLYNDSLIVKSYVQYCMMAF